MAENQRPGPGWEWFCHKYEFPFLGIRPDHSSSYTWELHNRSGGPEAIWGFPFWDFNDDELLHTATMPLKNTLSPRVRSLRSPLCQ
jgi:hypothetical protein